MTKTLFDSAAIGDLVLKNRFIRSATYDGGADRSGYATEWQVHLYESLAQGGVGLIVTGLASVHPSGRISAFQNIVSDDGALPGLKKLVTAAHSHGARIALQIAHCGREAHLYQSRHGNIALAPSRVSGDPRFPHPHRALTDDEIRDIVTAFGLSARRAREIGFDAVQIHAAHGYLVSQFLSPHTNRRRDRWGGDAHRRFRFLEEIYTAIRGHVGDDFAVMIKLGVEDGVSGGLSFSEGRQYALRCDQLGFDALEISQGLRGRFYDQTEFRTGIHERTDEAYFKGWARQIAREVDAPVILVGGVRSLEGIRQATMDSYIAFVAMSRPLISEPHIIDRWQSGDLRPSRCTSCNHCFERLLKGKSLECLLDH
jgi:2,4-dienoyl-CoA reductase-like NADH-dependent reductase (Old Yellow Enzyme family)